MNVEEDGRASVGGGNGKLRQWLIDQIHSESYPGLVWENDEKTIFRIPWKHAGKQDYNRDEDAALFKAWALFKGKYKEGVDKPDPPTWKTRLRCALNKSNDFDELVDRSQLDISEPYKVYRIIPESAKRGVKNGNMEETQARSNSTGYIPAYPSLQNQVLDYMDSQDSREWLEYTQTDEQPLPPLTHQHGPQAELPYGQCHYPSTPGRSWSGSVPENDFGLHVSLFYRESLVKHVVTTSPEGCQITSYPPSSRSSSPSSPAGPEEKLYGGGAEVILFPHPFPESQRQGAEKLPDVLEKGVLLWMGQDGLYAKRLCQGRVYWEGPLAPHRDKPNKLEKEQTCKLFDTQHFVSELYGGRIPRHVVVLCFGDEYPDLQRQTKMITVQVEPVFARKLLHYYQQQSGGQWHGYDHIHEQDARPPAHYPAQRPLQHIQE